METSTLALAAGPAAAPELDLDAIRAAYWCQRDYWRDVVRDAMPNAEHNPRDLVIAARTLASLYAIDHQIRETHGDAFGLEDLRSLQAEVIGVRKCRDPRNVAQRCATLALGNVAAKVTRRAAAAPDPFEGSRHAIASKRSNSGRTDKRVTRAGVAPVQGSPDRDIHGARTGIAGRDSLTSSMAIHLLTHAPRRASGANGLYVQSVTASAFNMASVSDLRQWAEITDPMPEIDPRDACAVHRADMAGQNGVLALTDRYNDRHSFKRANRPPRTKLRRPIPRKSEVAAGLAHETTNAKGNKVRRWNDPDTITPAAPPRKLPAVVEPIAIERETCAPHAGGPINYWNVTTCATFPTRERVIYQSRATCQHDHVKRDQNGTPRWTCDSAGTITLAPRAVNRLWHRHQSIPRGHTASGPNYMRGARTRRTRTQITDPRHAPTDERGWIALASGVLAGERCEIATRDGSRVVISHGAAGRYTLNVWDHDGARIARPTAPTAPTARRRTPDAIGTLAHVLTQ